MYVYISLELLCLVVEAAMLLREKETADFKAAMQLIMRSKNGLYLRYTVCTHVSTVYINAVTSLVLACSSRCLGGSQ